MSDFSVRSESVDVEQIMRQIRARIREKRGVDYTEEEIRELANVKLEKFIDPKGVRSGLLEEYRRVSTPEPPAPNYAFGEDTLYETHRAPIRWLRALFRPLLKLLFNPNPLIQALHIQSELNTRYAERAARREQLDALHYEVIHNLVVELTRTGVEVKALKMRLESMASRLDFDERRARSLEGVVQYRAGAVAPLPPPTGQDQGRPDQGRRDQGRRDQGPRNQGGRDQRPRDQNQRDQGQRDHGQRNQGPRDQGPRSQQAPPQSAAPQPPPQQSSFNAAPAPQPPVPEAIVAPATPPPSSAVVPEAQGATGVQTPRQGEPAFQGNALDADGNERRARRRRRRGRRRPAFGADNAGAAAGAPGSATPDAFPPSPLPEPHGDALDEDGDDEPVSPTFRSGVVDASPSPVEPPVSRTFNPAVVDASRSPVESPVSPTFRSGVVDAPSPQAEPPVTPTSRPDVVDASRSPAEPPVRSAFRSQVVDAPAPPAEPPVDPTFRSGVVDAPPSPDGPSEPPSGS